MTTIEVESLIIGAGRSEWRSGQEVLGHFDLATQQRFLPSGRVHLVPISEAEPDGTITSLMSGDPFGSVAKRRIGVDAEATEHLGRYLTNSGPAVEKHDALLGPR